MKTLKKYSMAIIAIAAITIFSAFNLYQKLDPPQDGWYQLNVTENDTPTEYNNPENQQIMAHLPLGPQSGCDQETPDNEPCAVFLNFDNYSGPAPGTSTTVKDLTDAGAQIDPLSETDSPDGYARKEE